MGPPHSWLCITTVYDLTNCTWIWRDGHVPLLPVDIGSWAIRFFDSLIVSPRGLHLSPIVGAISLANWTVAALWFKVCPEDGNLVLKRLFLVAWTPVKAAINNFPSPFWITVCSRSAKLTPSQGLAFFLADNLPPYGKSCVNRIRNLVSIKHLHSQATKEVVTNKKGKMKCLLQKRLQCFCEHLLLDI